RYAFGTRCFSIAARPRNSVRRSSASAPRLTSTRRDAGRPRKTFHRRRAGIEKGWVGMGRLESPVSGSRRRDGPSDGHSLSSVSARGSGVAAHAQVALHPEERRLLHKCPAERSHHSRAESQSRAILEEFRRRRPQFLQSSLHTTGARFPESSSYATTTLDRIAPSFSVESSIREFVEQHKKGAAKVRREAFQYSLAAREKPFTRRPSTPDDRSRRVEEIADFGRRRFARPRIEVRRQAAR